MGAKKIEIETAMFAAEIDRFFKNHNRPNTTGIKVKCNTLTLFVLVVQSQGQ